MAQTLFQAHLKPKLKTIIVPFAVPFCLWVALEKCSIGGNKNQRVFLILCLHLESILAVD